jgi:Ricin-type beta-trefoil lectin domain-like
MRCLPLVAVLALCACASQSRPDASFASAPIVAGSVCMKVSAPPSALGLDPFYTKCCDAAGIAVVAAGVVPDDALRQAARVTAALFAPIPGVRKIFIRDGIRVSIIGEHQAFGDIPENGPETRADPARFANKRADGAFSPKTSGPPDPVVSDGEENVLCYARDPYDRGENNLVHELAHNIKVQGLQTLDATFEGRVKTAFDAARAQGKYQGLYAGRSPEEYWAEGVQDYFNVHGTHDPNDINTRAQLSAYDPTLFAIIDGVFHGAPLLPACPAPSVTTFGSARFRLRSALNGRSLDVTSLNPSGNYSGQAWTITATGDGCYRLTNEFQPGLALDVANNGSHQPVMAAIREYSGQCWVFSDVTSGQFRIYNRYLGGGMSLGATSEGAVMSASANTPAQLWTVTPF